MQSCIKIKKKTNFICLFIRNSHFLQNFFFSFNTSLGRAFYGRSLKVGLRECTVNPISFFKFNLALSNQVKPFLPSNCSDFRRKEGIYMLGFF